MNDNWIEIVETLQPHVKYNSTELKYQQEIENCLKFLGWRSFFLIYRKLRIKTKNNRRGISDFLDGFIYIFFLHQKKLIT